jgi:hypothetical protein
MTLGDLIERFLPGERNPRRSLLIDKDPLPLIKYLLKQTELIKMYHFSPFEFVQFKFELLSSDATQLFLWSVPHHPSGKPYVKFDLDWSQINTSIDCYVVWCLLNEVESYFPQPDGAFPLL